MPSAPYQHGLQNVFLEQAKTIILNNNLSPNRVGLRVAIATAIRNAFQCGKNGIDMLDDEFYKKGRWSW